VRSTDDLGLVDFERFCFSNVRLVANDDIFFDGKQRSVFGFCRDEMKIKDET
jgi:hypothetical protein